MPFLLPFFLRWSEMFFSLAFFQLSSVQLFYEKLYFAQFFLLELLAAVVSYEAQSFRIVVSPSGQWKTECLFLWKRCGEM